MKFNRKKVFKFAGEVTGCIVMGIVSAATQTLWYRIAEPKILDAMDKNDAKQKHPIGFRGGSPEGLLSSFRRFCKFLYGGERIYVGENPIASYEAGYGVGNELTGTTLKSFSSLSYADFANRIMERKLAQLVERQVKFL